jgi:pimeloyl-ACP methyl ester carboxylesterase
VPPLAAFVRRLARFGRVLTFDKRGTGLSDPVPASELPSIEEWMDDLRTVMDESGIDRAVLVANLASSFMAMVFAATYPARVRALVMVNAYPRFTRADDYPGDAALVEQESRYERQAASPGTAIAMTRMINLIDVRSVLPTITVPTMVISRADPAAVPAAHRPTGGRTRPGPGDDLVHRHFGSTRLAAEHGDRAWRELLERHHALVRSELARFRGREVDTAGDGFLAVFDGPAAPSGVHPPQSGACSRSESRSGPAFTPAKSRWSARESGASLSTSVPACRPSRAQVRSSSARQCATWSQGRVCNSKTVVPASSKVCRTRGGSRAHRWLTVFG